MDSSEKGCMKKYLLITVMVSIGILAKADSTAAPTKTNAKSNTSPSMQKAIAGVPKKHETVCSAKSANSALIIIDMQPYFANRGGQQNSQENKAKIGKIIEMQIASINKAKEANIPIVFLEYDCGPCDPTDSKLKAAALNYKNARFIKKDTDGMFESYNKYRKDLVDFLNKNSVGTLIIAGANGGACVLRSITGALENNCNVVAFNAGIADFNYKDFIYPYVGQYSHIKPNCKDCSFKEVSSVENVAELMVNYSHKPSGGFENSNSTSGTW